MMLGSWLGLPSSGKALAVRLAALATSKHQIVLDFWQRSGVETKPLTGSENGGYNMIPPRFMIIYGCGYLMLLFVESFLSTGFGVPYFHGLRMTVLHVFCFVNEGTGL
jgi:hypothetical protein